MFLCLLYSNYTSAYVVNKMVVVTLQCFSASPLVSGALLGLDRHLEAAWVALATASHGLAALAAACECASV